ncbi:MAG: DNA repair protein RadA [Oscillospiraceae bacterium]|nr:DNA repair protein RadA [Oscillospiraceae bacterium]
MAQKSKSVYVCSECGYETPRWLGQCPSCSEWNTLNEEIKTVVKESPVKRTSIVGRSKTYALSEITADTNHRYNTGLTELDRVLGGGLVKGSIVLLSGDPGIGKSTILLQICEYLGQGLKIMYVSGEESAHQIKLRASRLCVETENLSILCETDAQYICEYILSEKPDVVIVDSIQTMEIGELTSSPGSVTQVRECTNLFTRTAKSSNIPVFLVGHVNKDGNIAGPKVLEHIVDCVLYFEGDRNTSYRILRAVKNRYGSTNEIGVFEMLDNGLTQVDNPSMMLISGQPKNVSGTCVACLMEGSRPILAEIQSLVTPTGFGTPRRMATGIDYNRMAMLIAVIEKRAGYFLGNMDCYTNVIGGLKIEETAADLSVALAIVSSLKDIIVPEKTLAFGEIGLAGEIRSVTCCEQRIKEAAKLGFERCIIPKHNHSKLPKYLSNDIDIVPVKDIREAFKAVMN